MRISCLCRFMPLESALASFLFGVSKNSATGISLAARDAENVSYG